MRPACFAVLLITVLSLHAQGQRTSVRSVSVQIVSRGASSLEGWNVEAQNVSGRAPADVEALGNGTFRFLAVEGETYELTITNGRGEFLQRETLRVGSAAEPFLVRVAPTEKGAAARPESSVSVRQLLIPKKAEKEFRRSESALEAGDIHNAIEHLEKAVQIYPQYLEARNNLGARYIVLGQYEKAVSELQEAIAIDPNVARPYTNLGLALYYLGRYAEAEVAERRAMELDPNSVRARNLLGWALAAEGKNTPELIELLHQTAEQIPDGRLVLAQVLLKQGATAAAVTELKAYLNSPKATRKPLAQCWLAKINQATDTATCGAGSARP